MEQRDFLEKEAKRTPEKELEVRMLIEQYRAAMTENAALKDEVAELKEQLAQLKKVVYGQKSEKTEIVAEKSETLRLLGSCETEVCGRSAE